MEVIREPLCQLLQPLLMLLTAFAPLADDGTREAKAVITDAHGNPPPVSAPFGRMLVFDGRTSIHGLRASSVKWNVRPAEMDARKWAPIPNAFAITPEPLDYYDKEQTQPKPYDLVVNLAVALGDSVDQVTLTIRCGHGGQPPPDPTPIDSDADGVPDTRDKCPGTPRGTAVDADGCPKSPPPVKHDSLFIVVIENVLAPSDTWGKSRNSSYWDTLAAKGHRYRFYSHATEERLGKQYVKDATGYPLPALLIYDAKTGERLEAKTFVSLTDISNLIFQFTGK